MRTLFKHTKPIEKDFIDIRKEQNFLINKLETVEKNPTWHSGKGVASRGVGKNKDFYIDKLTGKIYQKENGTWV